MIATLALVALLAVAGWLVFVGAVCLLRPALARHTLTRMGSTWPIQIGEHTLRGSAGIALVLRAEASKAPMVFTVAGWFIVATSVLILIAPRRWHHALSVWFAAIIPERAWPGIGLTSFAFAGLLAYSAV